MNSVCTCETYTAANAIDRRPCSSGKTETFSSGFLFPFLLQHLPFQYKILNWNWIQRIISCFCYFCDYTLIPYKKQVFSVKLYQPQMSTSDISQKYLLYSCKYHLQNTFSHGILFLYMCSVMFPDISCQIPWYFLCLYTGVSIMKHSDFNRRKKNETSKRKKENQSKKRTSRCTSRNKSGNASNSSSNISQKNTNRQNANSDANEEQKKAVDPVKNASLHARNANSRKILKM